MHYNAGSIPAAPFAQNTVKNTLVEIFEIGIMRILIGGNKMKNNYNKKRINPIYLKHKKFTATYRKINREFPKMSHFMLKDLLEIDGFSDVAIGFGTGIGLDVIRELARGNTCCVSKTTFLRLLSLYERVFCNWFALQGEEGQ